VAALAVGNRAALSDIANRPAHRSLDIQDWVVSSLWMSTKRAAFANSCVHAWGFLHLQMCRQNTHFLGDSLETCRLVVSVLHRGCVRLHRVAANAAALMCPALEHFGAIESPAALPAEVMRA
jgi:hypothetical protein